MKDFKNANSASFNTFQLQPQQKVHKHPAATNPATRESAPPSLGPASLGPALAPNTHRKIASQPSVYPQSGSTIVNPSQRAIDLQSSPPNTITFVPEWFPRPHVLNNYILNATLDEPRIPVMPTGPIHETVYGYSDGTCTAPVKDQLHWEIRQLKRQIDDLKGQVGRLSAANANLGRYAVDNMTTTAKYEGEMRAMRESWEVERTGLEMENVRLNALLESVTEEVMEYDDVKEEDKEVKKEDELEEGEIKE